MAFRAEETDWARIAGLYQLLGQRLPSPIVELNRAVAVGMAYGPEAGLDVLDRLIGTGALPGYHLVSSVRGDLLLKLGRPGEARAEFERAAGLTGNDRERELMLGRAQQAAELAGEVGRLSR